MLLKSTYRENTTKIVKVFDWKAQNIWGNTHLPMEIDFKPGGIGIVMFCAVSGQIKKLGFDPLGQWFYELFEGGDRKHSAIFNIYNYCNNPLQTVKKTTYYQQEVMLL